MKENTMDVKCCMYKQNRLYEKLKNAVIDMDEEEAGKTAEEIVSSGADIPKAVEYGLVGGMDVVAKYYDEETYFIPEVLMCADAMYAGMAPLKKAMPVSAETGQHVIVIGSVFGDIHDIGKNIVALFLEGSGFKVINLGRDVAPEVFVDAAEKYNADIIVISTLMTTTMWGMKDVIEMLKVRGLRDRVKVMVGGKPLSLNFAKKIGADGYSHDAKAAVALAKKLIYEDYSLQK